MEAVSVQTIEIDLAPFTGISLKYYAPAPMAPLSIRTENESNTKGIVIGNDYDTPDGSCVRDYIHVQDLCDTHMLALEKLMSTSKSDLFNLHNAFIFVR